MASQLALLCSCTLASPHPVELESVVKSLDRQPENFILRRETGRSCVTSTPYLAPITFPSRIPVN